MSREGWEMPEEKTPEGPDLNGAVRIAAIVGVAWGACLLVALVALWSGSPVIAATGQAGDTFGIVNALFSGLALVGVTIAVIYQHHELRLAQEGAAGEKDAREATVVMMSRQAEHMLMSARLDAVQTLAQATDGLATLTVLPTLDTDEERKAFSDQVVELRLAHQYARILLNHVDQAGFDWGKIPPEDQTPYRKYLIFTLRWAAARMRPSDPHYSADYAAAPDIRGQLELLLAQPGIFRTPDASRVLGALGQLQARDTKLQQDLERSLAPFGDEPPDPDGVWEPITTEDHALEFDGLEPWRKAREDAARPVRDEYRLKFPAFLDMVANCYLVP
jgi:hypothetical protein